MTRPNPVLKRYYEVWVERDLFNDLTLRRQWGSTVTRRGNMKSEPLGDKTDIQKVLHTLFKTRKKHGYLICGG
jgi:predicted DNA-binding WGR domain protein